MADNFLSQDEVDAVLKGVTGEIDEAPAESDDHSGVPPYNLATQERIVRGRMPTLEIINERFARQLRIGLYNFLRRGVEISVGPVKVSKYSEFIRNLVVPTNLNLVQFKPLRGTALMIFNPDLVFLMVDNLFGGDGRFHTRVEGRDSTQTEQRIIQRVLNISTSQHTLGQACDIEIPGMPTLELADWVARNLEFDQIICECYDPARGPNSGWVHVSLVPPGMGENRGKLTSFVLDPRAGQYVYVAGLRASTWEA